ncbi:acyl-CoA dehydrogenase family protein [Agromyces aerolatus]|uniref:acyl-CoA dehydrogenase family protein n=1 Tax=Agromyces sp. LY-1074 TaxID=3074080 RepID=UPI0028564973|nr:MULTISPECIES: acyl-CoA dehydrogenase family protein [unclassified Agromyces]MDR5699140.1 acyl-CoA dehydrogenase family protein [Agromyces sp. LY-1074]MDR5705081.1 acyl-CoA dehydrogenase family protein [Agromyces sp. LY-1358]
MNNTVSEEASDLGQAVGEAIDAAGGVDLVREFERDPAARAGVVERLLGPLGIWEIAPREDQVQLEAAAEACRAAGARLLMYPIAERLARPEGADAILLVPTTGRRAAVHADLDLNWAAATLRGDTAQLTRRGELVGEKLAMFVAEIDAEIDVDRPQENAELVITLQSWWLLGVLERSLADTVVYTNERQQFGRPIIKFQATQFRLSDVAVAVQGLAELAKYTLWSIAQGDRSTALVDAVALRVSALQAADAVLRAGHQLHGAMGFADETNMSQYSRHTQGYRRLPEGETRGQLILSELVAEHGWASLFPIEAGAARRRGAAVRV